jgi:hypothetical protein
VLLTVLAACGGHSPGNTEPKAPPTLAVADAFLLESTGAEPEDTTLTITAGFQRYVLVVYPPPDNTVFAELYFPPGAFAVAPGSPVTLKVTPRPGLFGLDFESSAPVLPGATITFKYAIHFAAPVAAVRRYGSEDAYNAALQVARLGTGDQLTLLPSTHVSPDDLQSPLPGPGRYLVAAPR